jgi:hypothetical protein
MNLPEELPHPDAGFEIGVGLEPVEDFPSDDLLARPGDQPLIDNWRSNTCFRLTPTEESPK